MLRVFSYPGRILYVGPKLSFFNLLVFDLSGPHMIFYQLNIGHVKEIGPKTLDRLFSALEQ